MGLTGPLRAKFMPYEQIGGRYQDVRCRIPDTDKASRVLGFQAKVRLDAGLVQTVAWHRQRREELALAGPSPQAPAPPPGGSQSLPELVEAPS